MPTTISSSCEEKTEAVIKKIQESFPDLPSEKLAEFVQNVLKIEIKC